MAPAFNGIYSSFNTLSFVKDAVKKLILFSEEFKSIEQYNTPIDHINSIKLKNINFAYENKGKQVLKNINIELKKNNIYLLSGKSGSGKSTLLNILIGLIKFDGGNFLLNNKEVEIYENLNWFKNSLCFSKYKFIK